MSSLPRGTAAKRQGVAQGDDPIFLVLVLRDLRVRMRDLGETVPVVVLPVEHHPQIVRRDPNTAVIAPNALRIARSEHS